MLTTLLRPAHAACDSPKVEEMKDCCVIGLKLPAQIEVW